MTAWKCPNDDCGGGFPKPIKWQGEYVCPWCYESLASRHTNGDVEIERAMQPTPVVACRSSDDEDDGLDTVTRVFRRIFD